MMKFIPERRALLKAVSSLIPLGAAGCMRSAASEPAAAGLEKLEPRYAQATFLNEAERRFVSAAVARLIPTDDLGPGAHEAGVPLFIDRQLAGPFGRAETWYMQGPWRHGTGEQGYQLRFSPAQLYRAAIADVEDYCRHTYGKSFADLDGASQDKVLTALEKGEVNLVHAPAKDFFDMLWKNTQEGFLADPMYGGNRDFAGWKLIGFPGPRYNYVDEIEQHGKRYTLPPVSIVGRNPGPGGKSS